MTGFIQGTENAVSRRANGYSTALLQVHLTQPNVKSNTKLETKGHALISIAAADLARKGVVAHS